MDFKYKHDVDDLPDCPPASCSSGARTAFHIVHSEPNDPRNYKPPGIVKPSRLAKEKATRPPSEVCDLCALSMYATEDQIRAAFADLKNRYPKIEKTIGSHYATGSLTEAHGVFDETDAAGHFNFYEAATTNCASFFSVVGPL